MTQVVVEQTHRHLLQGPGGRRHLVHHIRAPRVSLDHPLQTTHLTLNPP
jgi:hypothetical protein